MLYKNQNFTGISIHLLHEKASGDNHNLWFSGYASVFDVLDHDNDIICHGAFDEHIANLDSPRSIKLLWEHNVNSPIGIVEAIKSDFYGLYVEGEILTKFKKGKEVADFIANDLISTLSIGYLVDDYFMDGEIRHLTKLTLMEISLVTMPANKNAVITDYSYKNDDEIEYR